METATLAEDGDRIVSQKMGDAMGIFHGDIPWDSSTLVLRTKRKG